MKRERAIARRLVIGAEAFDRESACQRLLCPPVTMVLNSASGHPRAHERDDGRQAFDPRA